ncbi:MAG: 60S ribosomal export protein NMD3 [Halobacteriota archaeon]
MVLESICPGCGRPSSGLCSSCSTKGHLLAASPDVFTLKVCPVCSDVFFKGKWVEENTTDVISRAIKETLVIQAEEAVTTITVDDVSSSLTKAHVHVEGFVQEQIVHEDFDVHVRLHRETCDRCSRIAGGYYASKVQIRAQGRTPDERELERTLEIARDALTHASKADRMAFIAKTARLKEGLDLYVGTTKAAKRIVTALIKQMGGQLSTSARLAGRRDGKDLQRVTYAVRLPQFTVGSLICAKGDAYEICSAKSTMNVIRLRDGQCISLPVADLDKARLLGSRYASQRTVVISVDNDEVQILDPDTYTTLTIAKPPFISKEHEGHEIDVVKTAEGIFVLP